MKLTSREIECLEYMTKGYSGKEIARELGISAQTVRNHVLHIYRKMRISELEGNLRVHCVLKYLQMKREGSLECLQSSSQSSSDGSSSQPSSLQRLV